MRYQMGGVRLTCPCCQNDTFQKDYRQLNSRGATFFGLDWANKEAAILICKRCSYISWFMEDPSEV
ncbi:hypothetical protein [Brevibacillus panacihumi]|uniref:hypothetical protein n=1 Tax=Brevibacillus panacihumi TaxID=497735 RepID=UPI003D1FBD96